MTTRPKKAAAPPLRHVRGWLQLPADAAGAVPAAGVVEVRDVSLQDAAAPLLASVRVQAESIVAGGRVPFVVEVPEVEAARSLNLRVQLEAGGQVFLSTQSLPVAARGEVSGLLAPLTRIDG